MDSLLQDVRFAFRTLRRTPGTTLVAMVTLAVAIGLSTSVFSLVNAISFRPLPYPDPEQLIQLYTTHRASEQTTGVSGADALDWQARARLVDGIAVYQEQSFAVWLGHGAENLSGMRATANLFSVLGVRPQLGRGLLPEDDRSGAPVVVLSHALWRDRFGAEASVLGRTLRIDGVVHEIIGVMPERFGFVDFSRFWIPLDARALADRANREFQAITRLRTGVSIHDATRELSAISGDLAVSHPATNDGWGVASISLEGTRSEAFFLAIIAAAVFVLLIACANVGNLLLARGAARRGELAVRLLIGARRSRVLRQLITESAVLALGGTALGLLIALWGTDLMAALLPTDQMPLWIDFGADWRVASYTVATVILAVLTFGAAPALTILHGDLAFVVRDGSRRTTASHASTRMRNGLIVAQIALSLVLLTAAGALLRSALATGNASPGYDPSAILRLSVPLSEQRYPDEQRRQVYLQKALAGLARTNGAVGIAATASLPPARVAGASSAGWGPVTPEGAVPAIRQPSVTLSAVTSAFFSVLGLPVLRGRAFTDADDAGGARVALVSQQLATELWPDQDPIGRKLKLAPAEQAAEWLTVVGIVSNRFDIGRGGGGPPRRARAELYVPITQGVGQNISFLVRTSRGQPASIAAAARRALQSIDSDQPITEIVPLADVVYDNVRVQRWLGGLAGTFALLALVLSAIGLFGVIAYAVTQRSHEIGIRLALGAQPQDVVRLLVGVGSRLVGWGIGIGLAGALAASQVLAALVFGASPRDPLTLALVSLLLAAVALAASWLPARRAARVDPLQSIASN